MKKRAFTFLFYILITNILVTAQDAEILNETTLATVSNKGQLTINYSVSIQINNRRAEDLTDFSINSTKRSTVNIDAYITNINGDILNKLDRKEIKRSSASSYTTFYQDDFIEHFTLRHNSYPYIIHCAYTMKYNEFLSIARWSPVYNHKYPTRNASLTLIIPSEYRINIKEQNIKHSQLTNENGSNTYRWESSYNQIIKSECNSAPSTDILPFVTIVPQSFNYGGSGSFESWSLYGKWVDNLLTGLNDLPDDEKSKVYEIVNDRSDKKDKVKALYHYLQDNTRYINISIGIGGFKPYPASYVSYNKYGDCKALTNYMKSLLETAGIKSYYSLINSDETIESVDDSFPNQQFSHAFLMVPVDIDTFWLECTSQNAPFAYVGTSTQNRSALVIDGLNSKLIKTPALKDIDVLNHTITTIDVNLTGKSNIKIGSVCRGSSFEFLKELSKEVTLKDQDNYIKERLHLSDFELLKWSFEQKDRDSASIKLDLELESTDFCKKYESEYVLNFLPTNFSKFENPKDRKLPLVFNYPIWERNTTKFNLPKDIRISYIPADTIIVNRFGTYELHFVKNEQIITVDKNIKIHSGKYGLNEYPEFFNFIKAIQAIERKNHPILTL